MTKKLFLLAACALSLVACNKNAQNAQEQAFAQQRDSLERIIAQQRTEFDDMISTLNDIEEGFREISEAEGRVTVAQQGEGASSKARIQENMQFIQSAMQQNRELINKLRRQLRESSVQGEQLRRTIDNLTAQLTEKEETLQRLRAELEAKDIHIAELDETIADLHEDMATMKEEGEKKDETIDKQDKMLNTAWFVFGTKKELKAQNIPTKRSQQLSSDFNKDYFTKIDIRIDKEIKLYSKDAEIITTHPAGTYTLERDANKQYVLRITDPQQFWSTSKYLIVVVD